MRNFLLYLCTILVSAGACITPAFSAEPFAAAEPAVAAPVVAAPATALAARADGTPIFADGQVTAKEVTVLTLPGTTRSEVILAAGSQATFTTVDQELRILLERGTIQVDVEGLGPWTAITVVGGSSQVTVTGTLFIVARDRRDVDTVALVRGQVQVRLRSAIVATLGRDPTVDLTASQQVTAGPTGLTAVAPLSTPMLTPASTSKNTGEADAIADAIMDGMLDDAVSAAQEAGEDIIDTVGGVIILPPPPPN